MKRTILTIATVVMMVFTLSAFASEKNAPSINMSTKSLMSYYLEATTLGSLDLSNYLFADNFEYKNSANNNTFNKKEYLAFLKLHKGLKFDCETNYQLLDQSGQTCLAKATMNFNNFTRVDYITLTQSKDGWKISNVLTTYP